MNSSGDLTLIRRNPLLIKGSEWQARRESNPDLWYRKPLFYPLNYRPCDGQKLERWGMKSKRYFALRDFEGLGESGQMLPERVACSR